MPALNVLWFVPPAIALVAEAGGIGHSVAIRAQRNTSSDAQFEALASGAVDVVVTAMDNVMDWNLREGPRDFRIVAQMERTTPLTLVGRPGIGHVHALHGARILVDAPRNGFVVALRAMLADEGFGPQDYSLVPVGGVKERFDALVAGRGDATLLGPPFDGMALKEDLNLITCIDERYPDFPGQGLVTRAGSLHRIASTLSAWLANLDRARIRIGEDPACARRAVMAAGLPEAAVDRMLSTTPLSLWPDRAGVELLIAQRRQAGLPGGDTCYDALVDPSALPRP